MRPVYSQSKNRLFSGEMRRRAIAKGKQQDRDVQPEPVWCGKAPFMGFQPCPGYGLTKHPVPFSGSAADTLHVLWRAGLFFLFFISSCMFMALRYLSIHERSVRFDVSLNFFFNSNCRCVSPQRPPGIGMPVHRGYAVSHRQCGCEPEVFTSAS